MCRTSYYIHVCFGNCVPFSHACELLAVELRMEEEPSCEVPRFSHSVNFSCIYSSKGIREWNKSCLFSQLTSDIEWIITKLHLLDTCRPWLPARSHFATNTTRQRSLWPQCKLLMVVTLLLAAVHTQAGEISNQGNRSVLGRTFVYSFIVKHHRAANPSRYKTSKLCYFFKDHIRPMHKTQKLAWGTLEHWAHGLPVSFWIMANWTITISSPLNARI